METDRKTIGLSSINKSIIEKLIDQGLFKEQMDVARFALALAVREEIDLEEVIGAETVWNVGSFDPDGR